MSRSKWSTPLVLATLVVLACGCSNGGTRLDGAVFATHVPMVRNATFDGQKDGSYGDTAEDTMKGKSWFFITDRPMDEVVSFYEKELPGWPKVSDGYGNNPTVTFSNKPEGAEDGECIQVIISPGKVQIHESYKSNRENRQKS